MPWQNVRPTSSEKITGICLENEEMKSSMARLEIWSGDPLSATYRPFCSADNCQEYRGTILGDGSILKETVLCILLRSPSSGLKD